MTSGTERRGIYYIVTMRDVKERVTGCVTSRTSHLRQDLARESWMIVLIHLTGLRGTARMAQVAENDVGLPEPVSPPTAPAQTAVPHQMCL